MEESANSNPTTTTDANLTRISIAELLLLQLVCAILLFCDLFLVGDRPPLSTILIPTTITTWVAYRQRALKHVRHVNPFSTGAVTVTISMAIASTISPPLNDSVEGIVVFVLIAGIACGLFLGLCSVFFAEGISIVVAKFRKEK